MSVAFQIQLGRSRLLERLARLPWVMVSVVVAVLVADRSQHAWPLWLGVFAGLVILTWPWALPRRMSAEQRATASLQQRDARSSQRLASSGQVVALAADQSGQLSVQCAQGAELEAVRLKRVLRLPGLIVLHVSARQLRPNRPQAWQVVIGHDAVSGDEWRTLSVWLQWFARGARSDQ